MSEKSSEETPYKTLGKSLQTARQNAKETVAETSGAVEIDEITLVKIEKGIERPSEDILLLLISHFGVQDDAAVKLWELAGYDKNHNHNEDESSNPKPLVMLMAMDSRIIYSDKVEIVASPNGVVINFLQAPDGPYQPQTVARIGMSREQTISFQKVLDQTLIQSVNPVNNSATQKSSETKHKPKQK